MCTTTTQLLSSGEFCKLHYDTIPVKSTFENVFFFFSIPITQKCQILSCDTLDANERYVAMYDFAVPSLSKLRMFYCNVSVAEN